MKSILIIAFLISTLSTWSAAQKPQTAVEMLRPTTTVETGRPLTQPSFIRAQTDAQVIRPQTEVNATQPMTSVDVIRPATTVKVIHPQTTVEMLHPQTPGFVAAQEDVSAGPKGGKSSGVTSAQAATSMSNFTPKQAKDFASAQKAAPLGGGENKLGNETNAAEKDAANKASLLGKQSNQNMDVNPKLSNLGGLGKSVEQKVEDKKKK